MDRRFQGESHNKVDGKGRVSIPVKFRRVLQNCDAEYAPGGQPRLYIAYGDPKKNYIQCLSGDAFDRIDAIIQAQAPGSKQQKLLMFLYYQKCEATHLDETGRMVLPQAARDKIGLEDEALFEGHGTEFHILNPAQAQSEEDRMLALIDEFAGGDDFFDPLTLASEPERPAP